MVRGRTVQLRATGVASRGQGAGGRLPGAHQPQRKRRASRTGLARTAPAGRVARLAPARARRAAGRPCRRLPAQHPRGHRRLPGGGEHRRRVEHLRARHGHQRRAGPLQADRTQGADRVRRRALRRPRLRPHRRWSRSCAKRCPASRTCSCIATSASTPASDKLAPVADFAQAIARDDEATARSNPHGCRSTIRLWIVYSSGTTGLPKPIVHGHGGTVLVGLALTACTTTSAAATQATAWASATTGTAPPAG